MLSTLSLDLVMILQRCSQSSPLRLLPLLEWVLLGIVVLLEATMTFLYPDSGRHLMNALGILIFALLGWVLPQRHSHKLLYTALELGLIVLMAGVGTLPLFQFLFIVVVIRNCILFEGVLRSQITALVFITTTLCQTYRMFYHGVPFTVSPEQLWLFWFGSLLTFGLVILFLQLLVDAVLTERQSQAELVVAHARLRDYALQVEELATLEERNRIARDIHDSLGHSLTIFNLHLEAAIRLFHTNPAQSETLLKELKQLGSKALQEVGQSVSALRSHPLEGQPLTTAITRLVDQFHRSSGILPTCDLDFSDPLPNQSAIAIYRLIQESLTNISKYAAATVVNISVQQQHGLIQVIVQDNGRGFEPHKNTTGFGLQGMRERILALAGEFSLDTAPGQGCLIRAYLPNNQIV